MKPEEINRPIAEACGWSVVHLVGDTYFGLSPDEKNESYTEEIPNYHGSLDACAEFERTLDRIDRREYVRQLYHITENDFGAHCATPPQRCEAFLRVKGLWKETNELPTPGT